MPIVCLVCSERSGSNILKAIVNAHSDVFISPPIPLFEFFGQIIGSYGDLANDANWGLLLDDVVDLLAVNHQPLPRKLDRNQLRAAIQVRCKERGRTIGEIIGACLEIFAEQEGAEIAGCKFSVAMQNLGEFLKSVAVTHIIYQVRDPRDVILSQYRGGFHEADPLIAARAWAETQSNAVKHIEESGLPVLKLHYEHLLGRNKIELKRIWRFLGVPEHQDVGDFYKSDLNQAAAKASHMWANLGKPLMKDNHNKFRKEWNYASARAVEKEIAEPMAQHGYARSWPWQFGALKERMPERHVIQPSDRDYIRPQLDKWAEINERANKRLVRSE